MSPVKKLPFVAAAAANISAAAAHPGHSVEIGAAYGVTHYFSGIDHIAASVAAGYLAAMVAKNQLAAAFGVLAFATAFSMWHGIAFFGGFRLAAFDVGFLASAIATMLLSSLLFRALRQNQAKREHSL